MEEMIMSKSKVVILGTLVLLLTMCCNFGALTDGLMEKAVEKIEDAEIPDGMLETAEVGLGAVATQAADVAEDAIENAQEGELDDAINQMLEEAVEGMQGADPSQIPYPMPADAQVYDYSNGMVTFQTNMNVAGVVDFYRQALSAQGYTERTINTVVDEQIASLVFDGDPSGIELVVQVTGMGDMSIVNVRLEDI
jgi:hypothetical protein